MAAKVARCSGWRLRKGMGGAQALLYGCSSVVSGVGRTGRSVQYDYVCVLQTIGMAENYRYFSVYLLTNVVSF